MPNGNGNLDPRTESVLLVAGAGTLIIGLYLLQKKKVTPPPPGGGLVSPCPPLGDVNGDGFVTDADALMVLQAEAGLITLTAAQHAAADVNGDGVVNSIDAEIIRQYIAGLITTFPACVRAAAQMVSPNAEQEESFMRLPR